MTFRGRPVRLVGLGVIVVVLGFLVIRFGPWFGDSDVPLDEDHPAHVALQSFADAWADGDLDDTLFAPGDENSAAVIDFVTSGLGIHGPGPEVEVTSIEAIEDQSERVRGRLLVTWDLGEDRIWSYPSSITVVEIDDEWLIEVAPSSIEPSLRSGEVLRARPAPGPRGRIVGTDGTVLASGESTVVVGIRKSRADDPADTARQVAELTSVPLRPLLERLESANDDEFVEVARLPRRAYDLVRDELQPIPGTVFDEEFEEAGVASDFARAILGEVGPATPEIIEESGGLVREGDRVGLSGIQASREAVLAGRPGLVVEAVGSFETRVLESFPGHDGEDVTITLDPRIQEIADDVTANRDHPTSLVAVRVSTGEVLAIGNGGGSYNRALLGRYAPGSAFKIVSAYAALTNLDLTPDSIVPCPETETVGRTFRNADGSAHGDVSLRTDFAVSCNTAFVALSRDLSAEQLAEAGAQLGFRPHDIGLPAFTASIPTDGDATEHAAQMLGQGRVEGSVLDVAMLSASIASGRSLSPVLIVEDGAADDAPLDPFAVDALRSMMRSAVTGGTATVLLGVPGGEVMAKTGTAEFGSETPPQTHAWMTGFQGDVAFAVVVEGGGGGAAVAGPIAAEFLTALAGD